MAIPQRPKPVEEPRQIVTLGKVPSLVVLSNNPEESRNECVAQVLNEAYSKASKLKLTAEESRLLVSNFKDSEFRRGAAGDQNKIYIEHASLRKRLNEVIGVGEWAFIVRRSWNESFVTKTRPPKPPGEVVNVRVYLEAVLIVRGCFVAEAIGDGNYYKNNASGNYGDAYESAKSSALRRCCKEFGVGLQAWNKDWCDEWMEKYPGFERPKSK